MLCPSPSPQEKPSRGRYPLFSACEPVAEQIPAVAMTDATGPMTIPANRPIGASSFMAATLVAFHVRKAVRKWLSKEKA
jgi:hypothetical protein